MFTATDMDTFLSFSIKCVPETIEELKAGYPTMREPSYFSKKHWSRVVLEGSIPDHLLDKWPNLSYELVLMKFAKRMQQRLKIESIPNSILK